MNNKYRKKIFVTFTLFALIISAIVMSWTKLTDIYVASAFVGKKLHIIERLNDLPYVDETVKKHSDYYLIFFLTPEECTVCNIGALEAFMNEIMVSSCCNIKGILVTDKYLSYQDSIALKNTNFMPVVDEKHNLSRDLKFVLNEKYYTFR